MGVLLLNVQGQSEVIQYISDFYEAQQPCISKTVGRRAKQTQIWAAWVLTKCILGTFDCQVFQISLKSFGAFSIFTTFDSPVSRKRMVIERNEPKVETRGTYLVYMRYFWLLRFQSQSEVIRYLSEISYLKQLFGAFPIIDNFVSRKRLVVERNGGKLGLGNTNNTYMW